MSVTYLSATRYSRKVLSCVGSYWHVCLHIYIDFKKSFDVVRCLISIGHDHSKFHPGVLVHPWLFFLGFLGLPACDDREKGFLPSALPSLDVTVPNQLVPFSTVKQISLYPYLSSIFFIWILYDLKILKHLRSSSISTATNIILFCSLTHHVFAPHSKLLLTNES